MMQMWSFRLCQCVIWHEVTSVLKEPTAVSILQVEVSHIGKWTGYTGPEGQVSHEEDWSS